MPRGPDSAEAPLPPASSETVVAIIGLGSRGLSVLERLVALARSNRSMRYRFLLIDPVGRGAGVHAVDQPDYLLLNTTACQVSMFPDSATLGHEPDLVGPNLYEWATQRGLRLGSDGCSIGVRGRALRPTDFLPRRLLGEYLGWFADLLESHLPGNATLQRHRAEVVDLIDDNDVVRLRLTNDTSLEAHYAFLTTGHRSEPGLSRSGGAGQEARWIDGPFPMPDRFVEVHREHTIAIAGFGLTAMDVVSALTRGRGGRFWRDEDGGLRYSPSGTEPSSIVLFSRSGVPFRARARICSFERTHRARLFTAQKLDELRRHTGSRALDLKQDVLPLLFDEMRIAHCERAAELAGRTNPFPPSMSGDGLREALDRLDRRPDAFDPEAALRNDDGMCLDDAVGYQDWLIARLRGDLADADLGVAGTPTRAALDIMRQLRDTFRYAIDFGGISDAALSDFYGRQIPRINRAVVGPQYERHEELVALLRAGIVSTPLGPAAEVDWSAQDGRWRLRSTRLRIGVQADADWLCMARVPKTLVRSSGAAPLHAAMWRRGALRARIDGESAVPGADVDREHRPIRRDGTVPARLWVLGPLAEGSIFYNHLVPSPGVWSRPLADAHACVQALAAHVRTSRARGNADRQRPASTPS